MLAGRICFRNTGDYIPNIFISHLQEWLSLGRRWQYKYRIAGVSRWIRYDYQVARRELILSIKSEDKVEYWLSLQLNFRYLCIWGNNYFIVKSGIILKKIYRGSFCSCRVRLLYNLPSDIWILLDVQGWVDMRFFVTWSRNVWVLLEARGRADLRSFIT